MTMKIIETDDDYISQFPWSIHTNPEKLVRAIKECAPGTEEVISDRIPTFKLNGNSFRRSKTILDCFQPRRSELRLRKNCQSTKAAWYELVSY